MYGAKPLASPVNCMHNLTQVCTVGTSSGPGHDYVHCVFLPLGNKEISVFCRLRAFGLQN